MCNPTKTLKPLQKKPKILTARRGSLLMLVAGVSGLLFACSYGPTPFTPNERMQIIDADRLALFAKQEVVDQPISLFEAMARALKYNLDHRIALLEKAVAQKQLDLSHFDLLPKITANAALKDRGKPDASSGFNITDGTASTSFSTAQDRTKATGNLTMVWNVLDFGVSAIQARQESDRVLIARENRRKAVHNLLQDVRATFWQAAGAQRLEDAIGPVIQEARNALVDARQVERERLKPQLEILRFQKALLEIVRQLQELRHQLSLAKTEFASLINLPPGSRFTLDIPEDPALNIPKMNMTIEEMEQLALDNRPEVREAMYNARISGGDVRKALLRLLPGLEFQVSHNWDSNSFAMNSQWQEAGARVVWNIMNVLQGPTAIRIAENKEELANMRRLTMHMAVLTQVHLSFRQYMDDQRRLKAAEEIDAVDRRILKNSSVTTSQDAQSRLEYISSAASAIMSRLQLYQAYADAQNAVGRIYVTLGVDLLPKALRSDEISVLAEALRAAIVDWNEGVSATVFQRLLDGLDTSSKQEVDGIMQPAAKEEVESSTWEEGVISDYFLEPKFFVDEKELAESPSSPIEEKEEKAVEDESIQPEISSPHILEKELKTSDTRSATAIVRTKPKKRGRKDSPVKGSSLSVLRRFETTWGKEVEEELFEEIQNMLQAWAKAWSRRDVGAYFAFYADQDFIPPRGQTLDRWRQRTSNTLNSLAFLQITLSELKVEQGGDGVIISDHATEGEPTELLRVSFRESYRSSHLQGISRKLLILGKTADGWKIYREAPSETLQPDAEENQTSSGFAIQVASMDQLESVEKAHIEWAEKGIQTTVVETLDQEERIRYSIRIAFFKEKDKALYFKWYLQLMEGVDSVIVATNAAEMGIKEERDGTPVDDGNTDVTPSQEKDAVKISQKPVSATTQANAVEKKSNDRKKKSQEGKGSP